jgi:hypothetical protein
MANGRPVPSSKVGLQTPARNGKPSLIPLIILSFLYLAYLLGVIIAPLYVEKLDDLFGNYFSPVLRLVTACVLFLLFLIIGIAIYLRKGSPAKPPVPQQRSRPRALKLTPDNPPVNRFKPVRPAETPLKNTTKNEAVPAKTDDKKPGKEEVIVYPALVEGGIFGDTYIRITDSKILKLRSMVVEPKYLK